MKLLDQYLSAQEKLLQYFDCEEAKEIVDHREFFWMINGDDSVCFSEEKSEGEDFDWTYESEIYGGRRQNGNIFKKDDFSMFLFSFDFGDGEYYAIFDNSKEIKE